MRTFRSAETDHLPVNGADFAEFAARLQADQAYRASRRHRIGRIALLALPALLAAGTLIGAHRNSAIDRQTTHVTTLDIDAREPMAKARWTDRSSSSAPTQMPPATTPEADIPVADPPHETNAAWVESLKQALDQTGSVQTLENPAVTESNQLLVSTGECAALYTVEPSVEEVNTMSVTATYFGHVSFFVHPDVLLRATHAEGIVGHVEGELILGKPVADVQAATTIISTDTPELCAGVAASLPDYAQRLEQAQAVLLDNQ